MENIFSKESQNSDDKPLFLTKSFELNFDKIEEIATASIGQTENMLWTELHKLE